MPFFSVIIPAYNREKFIEKAIYSILNQNFTDFEVIVIDDASTDLTENIIKSFTDNRIVYLRNESNLERCKTRNRGIEESNGKYICFLDSDDYHLPNHLEVIHSEILKRNNQNAFFFLNAWDETEDGVRTERNCPDFEDYEPFTYFLRYTVNPQRWVVHRSIFEKVQFDPEVLICEDMDTSLRILANKFPIFQIKERTTVYVSASDSFTHGDKNKWEKELFYLKRIFNKKELIGFLPREEKNRLLSMCYFHLSNKMFVEQNRLKTIYYGFKSFLLFPKSYNGSTNKTLLITCSYSIPFVGYLMKKIRNGLR